MHVTVYNAAKLLCLFEGYTTLASVGRHGVMDKPLFLYTRVQSSIAGFPSLWDERL